MKFSIDNAKRLRTWLLEKNCPQRVVFHHVPKCGGTSVGRALRKRYLLSQATVTPEASFRAFEAFSGRSDREQMLIDVLDLREQMMLYHLFEDVRCVSLHVRFSEVAHRAFKDKYKFVTVLREPVSRFISHYFWSVNKPSAHARIEEGFAEFLQTPRARRLGATYVEYYCGLPKDVDTASDMAISAAVANLKKFDVVGRLDDIPSFEFGLHQELGVRVRVGHENKATPARSSSKHDISKELRERVVELCAPDLAVWKAVNA